MHKSKNCISKARLKPSGYVFILAFFIGLSSCFDEDFVPAPATSLQISLDTLTFDTVFTTLGSTTLFFTIVNPTNENVIIDKIYLENTSQMFRLNINGVSANEQRDVKVLANDSIYAFVEVTVDPNQDISVSPFVINDRVIIESSATQQFVVLEAWGQNANYVTSKNSRGKLLRLSCNNGQIIWDDPKPYIVNGVLFIDSCTVVVPKGTKVYFHGGLAISDGAVFNDGALIVLPAGSIHVDGTVDEPVIFQGDRLEQSYQDIAGQWSGLRLLSDSKNNYFRNCTIKNSIVGLRVDSAAVAELNNVQIFNTSSIGIIGIQAKIFMDNVLVHSNEGQSCAFVYGGDYRLQHCTLANFGNQAPALYLDNFTCLDADCTQIGVYPLRFFSTNSIFSGSNDDEIQVVDISEGQEPELMQLSLNSTLLRIAETKDVINLNSICENCIEWTNEDLFLDVDEKLFSLDTLSIARDAGVLIISLPTDITGMPRDNMPDLGCYEFR